MPNLRDLKPFDNWILLISVTFITAVSSPQKTPQASQPNYNNLREGKGLGVTHLVSVKTRLRIPGHRPWIISLNLDQNGLVCVVGLVFPALP